MSEHPRDTVGNSETEAEPPLCVAGLGGEPLKLHEDIALMLLRDPRSGVPGLDAQIATSTAAADKNAAAFSIAQSVGQEVLHDPAQQCRIAAHSGCTTHHT